jgi:hypothetical protein
MYSTACHRQKHQTKQNPQQSAQIRPTERKKKKHFGKKCLYFST